MKNSVQPQIIKTSVGNQYVATYAGSLGNVEYYACKDSTGVKIVGYAAVVTAGRFGPVCSDYVVAAMRARNIADSAAPWWTKVLFSRQK